MITPVLSKPSTSSPWQDMRRAGQCPGRTVDCSTWCRRLVRLCTQPTGAMCCSFAGGSPVVVCSVPSWHGCGLGLSLQCHLRVCSGQFTCLHGQDVMMRSHSQPPHLNTWGAQDTAWRLSREGSTWVCFIWWENTQFAVAAGRVVWWAPRMVTCWRCGCLSGLPHCHHGNTWAAHGTARRLAAEVRRVGAAHEGHESANTRGRVMCTSCVAMVRVRGNAT
jgi:hypothetical protein